MHPADALTERLGLPIRDRDLLGQALVHSSWLHEHPDAARGHNERLEFLGDAVVNLAVSEALYRRHPTDDEGVLSARRAAIVSTPGLARLASRLELGEFLFLGEGEAQRGGRRRPALLASAFEAMVGAIYLDLGWEAVRDWIHQWAAQELAADQAMTSLKSPKSRLQEHTQRTTGDRPVYRLVEAVGPDHEKQFRIEVVVDGRVLGVGEGPSRRIAETSAAAEALDVIRLERQAARAAKGGARPSDDASAAGADAGLADELAEGIADEPDAPDVLVAVSEDDIDALEEETGGPEDGPPTVASAEPTSEVPARSDAAASSADGTPGGAAPDTDIAAAGS